MEERRRDGGVETVRPCHSVDHAVPLVTDLVTKVVQSFTESIPGLIVLRVTSHQILVQFDYFQIAIDIDQLVACNQEAVPRREPCRVARCEPRVLDMFFLEGAQ